MKLRFLAIDLGASGGRGSSVSSLPIVSLKEVSLPQPCARLDSVLGCGYTKSLPQSLRRRRR